MVPAGVAHRNATEHGEGIATNTAVGGKQDGSDAIPGTSKHADYCTPRRGLAWRKIQRQRVTLTGEDAPLSLGLPDLSLPAPIAMEYTGIVEILPVGCQEAGITRIKVPSNFDGRLP
jgi:hypothetical protein